MKLVRLILFCTILCAIFQPASSQDRERHGKIARFYIEEVVNNQKLELLNQVFLDTFLVHILRDSSQKLQTISGQATFLKYLFTAFPDIKYTVGDIIEQGDKIAMRVTLTATHRNEFWGYEASGNRISYLSEIFFFRFATGKVAESWVQHDLHNLFRQLKGEK